ncbi:hypothetical protein F5884DRAFT_873245 [Xylogone sp. PMI_703]|nr:hypothetical protein F5884DRAFT_873245 [Xylogone sp. PMI_703]
MVHWMLEVAWATLFAVSLYTGIAHLIVTIMETATVPMWSIGIGLILQFTEVLSTLIVEGFIPGYIQLGSLEEEIAVFFATSLYFIGMGNILVSAFLEGSMSLWSLLLASLFITVHSFFQILDIDIIDLLFELQVCFIQSIIWLIKKVAYIIGIVGIAIIETPTLLLFALMYSIMWLYDVYAEGLRYNSYAADEEEIIGMENFYNFHTDFATDSENDDHASDSGSSGLFWNGGEEDGQYGLGTYMFRDRHNRWYFAGHLSDDILIEDAAGPRTYTSSSIATFRTLQRYNAQYEQRQRTTGEH